MAKRLLFDRYIGLSHGALSGAKGGAAGGAVLIVAYYAVESVTHQRASLANSILDLLTLVLWVPVFSIVGAAVGATAGAAVGLLFGARARALTLWVIALPVCVSVCAYVVKVMLHLASASPTGPVVSPSINQEAAAIGIVSGLVGSSVAVRHFKKLSGQEAGRANAAVMSVTHE